MKNDMKQDRAMVKSAVHKHEKAMHPGKPITPMKRGGSVKGKSALSDYSSKNPMAFSAK